MSSHPFSKEFDQALRKIDEVWRLIARLDQRHAEPPQKRARRALPTTSPAWMLDLNYHTDGTPFVRINQGQEFALSLKLAHLLDILAADTKRCNDGTVDWKPVSAVRAALTVASGMRPVTPQALNQLVYRLRQELASHGLHPGLVQYHRGKRALRFFLRPSPLPDTDRQDRPQGGRPDENS